MNDTPQGDGNANSCNISALLSIFTNKNERYSARRRKPLQRLKI